MIALVSSGAGVGGLTGSAVPMPATVAVDELLLVAVVTKLSTSDSSPAAGWTKLDTFTGGLGDGMGAGTGSGRVSIFYKIALGTEGGTTVTFPISPTANSAYARCWSFSKDPANTWDLAVQGGAEDTPGTAWSFTTGSWNLKAGDLLFPSSMMNNNTTASGYVCAMTGITFGTAVEQNDAGSTVGDDVRLITTSHPVATGDATGTLTYTYNCGVGGTYSCTGATAIVRLREITPGGARRIFNV